MTEYSKMAKGKFTSTGLAQVINLPFQPDFVEFTNYTASAAFTDHRVLSAQWDVNMGQGFAITQVKNTTYQTDSVILNGISTFSAGQLLQFGPTLTVTDISKASPASVTTSGNHGLASGDVVILEGLFQTSTTGMPQINGIPFTVTRTGPTTFTIPWNTNQSNYTVISGAATGTPRCKKVLYPYLYFPGATVISAITGPNGTTIPTGTVQIDTASAHNFVAGQEVAFRVPSLWSSVEFNSLPNVVTPGSPIYGYVVAVTDYNTVIVSTPVAASFTAFTSNMSVTQSVGLSYAQIVAVGDVNTGGVQISSGSALYPPPYSLSIGTTQVNSINGPAIQGAFVNNTSQGFVIGAGTNVTDTAAVLVGAASDVIYWRAYLHDLSIP